jgi:hypothetical protein
MAKRIGGFPIDVESHAAYLQVPETPFSRSCGGLVRPPVAESGYVRTASTVEPMTFERFYETASIGGPTGAGKEVPGESLESAESRRQDWTSLMVLCQGHQSGRLSGWG